MIRRRTFLGCAGAAAGVAGCLSTVLGNEIHPEAITEMQILVDTDAGDPVAERALLRLVSPEPGLIEGTVAEAHTDLVAEDGSVSLPEDRHRSFTEAYDRVRYMVTLCGEDVEAIDPEGCIRAAVSWDVFDAISFGDTIAVELSEGEYALEATLTDHELGGTDDWDVKLDTTDVPDRAT